MATALLNLDTHTLTIKDDNDVEVYKRTFAPSMLYKPNESIDTGVSRRVRKEGYVTTGEPFEFDNASGSGYVYRLRAEKG